MFRSLSWAMHPWLWSSAIINSVYWLLVHVLDPSGELCVHGSRAQWQQPVRFLLSGGSSGFVPGSGHAGYRQSSWLELRLHARLRGKLRRERSRRLHADLQRGWYVRLLLYSIFFCPLFFWFFSLCTRSWWAVVNRLEGFLLILKISLLRIISFFHPEFLWQETTEL